MDSLLNLVAELLDEWDDEIDSEGHLKDPNGKLDDAERRAAKLLDDRYVGKSMIYRRRRRAAYLQIGKAIRARPAGIFHSRTLQIPAFGR
jgi:hypothetical protein